MVGANQEIKYIKNHFGCVILKIVNINGLLTLQVLSV